MTTVALTTTTATEIHDGSLDLIRVTNSGSKDVQIVNGTLISPGSYAEIAPNGAPVLAKLVHIGVGEVTVIDITPPEPSPGGTTVAPPVPSLVGDDLVLTIPEGSVWGIDGDGLPYYDPDGAASGEEAMLVVGIDGTPAVVTIGA